MSNVRVSIYPTRDNLLDELYDRRNISNINIPQILELTTTNK
jgi:hypothetical protein